MTTHLFSHSVRVLLCVSCGGPLELDLAADQSACSYCGAVNVLAARDDSPMVAGPAAVPVDEAQRMQRLRMQVGKPLLPPPALEALVPGGRIDPWKVQEVFAVWQSTREETRNTRSYDAAERLVYLTMVLANHHSQHQDPLRQRAMFESALAVFTLPRHRQVMRGFLSRAAAREGDLEAAEAWLAPCDTRSDDLHTDTAYRISRAYVDTRRKAWTAVHDVLGAGAADVPVADHSEPLAVLLRANAWEQRGDLARATELLREAMKRGVAVRTSLESILAVHADWGLCRQTFQRAEAAHTAQAAKSAGGPLGGVGGIFFWIGVLLLIVSVICIVLMALFGVGAAVAGVIPALIRLRPAMSVSIASFAGICGTLAFVCLMILPTTLPMGGIFTAIGYAFRKSAKRAERLRLHGIRGTAQVLGLRPTGMSVNDVPQMELTLRVQLPDTDPFETKTSMLLPPHLAGQFAPGVTVAVRADPDNHREVILESD